MKLAIVVGHNSTSQGAVRRVAWAGSRRWRRWGWRGLRIGKMTGVKFTSQISVGNIMQSALLLIAMGAAFATLREVAINNKTTIQTEQRRSVEQDAPGSLTDNTGGTVGNALSAITGSSADDVLNDNFATLASEISDLRNALINAGIFG